MNIILSEVGIVLVLDFPAPLRLHGLQGALHLRGSADKCDREHYSAQPHFALLKVPRSEEVSGCVSVMSYDFTFCLNGES